ncbi:MAG: hypothetical protein K5863_20055 [Nitratireductor sp.]|uniref:COG3904 family protein n=1 Tax=Nitratireductor sp. TaxID=1872084 RepID=UPI00261F7E77|nr:hypothetical protein [Nitratireductor sp.]MCV0352378.1 hypothetical protein [Nitratireductor sp.]
MYNGYKYDEHRCAILGRMLDMQSSIQHIEEFDHPPMDTRSDPHDLLVFAISLRNWVAAARWAVDARDSERKNVWNLDCVGNFGIAKSLFLDSEQPNAEFEVTGAQLHVYGDIDAGFAKRFIEFLNSHPDLEEVTLGSAGGSVADAIVAGLAIRHRGLSTTIYGNCYSACPLVFLGGVRRVVWAAPYRLGFHQIYQGEGVPLPFDDDTYIALAGYAERMGADAELLLLWMYSAGPEEIYEPPVDDLCLARIATFVQRRCGIDLRP